MLKYINLDHLMLCAIRRWYKIKISSNMCDLSGLATNETVSAFYVAFLYILPTNCMCLLWVS